jgi:hypothetical protein
VTNRTFIVVVFAVLGVAFAASARQDDSIPYPTDFRQWAHVKSTLVGPENAAFKTNGGLHHFYANEKALEGYRTGKFPDGAILIDDLLEMQEGKGKGVSVEGTRKRLAVMMKNEKRFVSTGGWGFEVFPGDTRAGSLSADARTSCFDCHQTAPQNLVFSQLRK